MRGSAKVVWGLCLAAGLSAGAPQDAAAQLPGRNFRPALPPRVLPQDNGPAPEAISLPEQGPASRRPVTFQPDASPAGFEEIERVARQNIARPVTPLGGVSKSAEELSALAGGQIASRPTRSSIPAGRGDVSLTSPSGKAQPLEKGKSTPPAEGGATEENVEEELTTLVKGEFEEAWQKVLYVWRYPILKTSKVDLSLQVVVGGILLLWLGHMLARRLSAWLGNTVLRRLGLPPATSAPLQKMSFYALFGLFAMFSLQVLGVPMDVFTWLGGALAIGIGFGSQNVMNNFISGLILLIERPIRVGDMVQLDAHTGKVSEIGARSTRITTGANMEIIIPNSNFLQGNVINWTLSDDVISSKVTVGVAYGSPARDVSRLLAAAAGEHAHVLKTPPPSVSFTEFGEHAMLFELSFWLKMSQADRGRVESDLRFRIDELFAEGGIVIAYPQRDVHLNLMRPVEVRLEGAAPVVRELRGAA